MVGMCLWLLSTLFVFIRKVEGPPTLINFQLVFRFAIIPQFLSIDRVSFIVVRSFRRNILFLFFVEYWSSERIFSDEYNNLTCNKIPDIRKNQFKDCNTSDKQHKSFCSSLDHILKVSLNWLVPTMIFLRSLISSYLLSDFILGHAVDRLICRELKPLRLNKCLRL